MSNYWRETRREFEVDINGKERLVKVTRERDFTAAHIERERWLFIFQATGSLTIVVVLIGVMVGIRNQSQQSKDQLAQQRALYEVDVYTKMIKDAHKIIAYNPRSANFIEAKNELNEEIIPCLSLLHNRALTNKVDSFNATAGFIKFIYDIKDTLLYMDLITAEVFAARFGDTLFYKNNSQLYPLILHQREMMRYLSRFDSDDHIKASILDFKIDIATTQKTDFAEFENFYFSALCNARASKETVDLAGNAVYDRASGRRRKKAFLGAPDTCVPIFPEDLLRRNNIRLRLLRDEIIFLATTNNPLLSSK
jgi:hypothetical protein